MTLFASKLAMKDLGPLSYFPGIVMTRHAGGLLLSQNTNASDIIAHVRMTSCNPSATSVDTMQRLSTFSDTPYESCQCLTISHIHLS